MLVKLNTDKIIKYFAGSVLRITGISLAQKDLEVILKGNTVVIKAWECSLARVKYTYVPEKSETIEETIVSKAVEQITDLRKKIIQCKVYQLNQSIPIWEMEIKKSLMEQKISSAFVKSLKFNIVNHGYHYNHFAPKKEIKYDYPFLAIRISHPDNFNFSYPINVYDVFDPIEMEELKSNLFMAVLSRAIEKKSDLDEL